MKLNISYPATGCQKLMEIEDEKKIRIFYEKRMGHEVEADGLGDEWKGYVVRISGGNDKQGFPMKQGVLTSGRVRLLFYCKKGEQEIPGLTDNTIPRRLGPKRASKIRKLFNLTKEDDVRHFVVKRPLPQKEAFGNSCHVATQASSSCSEAQEGTKRKDDAAEYARLLAQRAKEAKEKRAEEVRRRRSASRGESQSSAGGKASISK
ncbi:40S ribosomal protein S6 [Caerostris extrusa]|uniref:40S ribosomal protein S6 n=1 Tax=Caerostris extrusa TaxID=172846 RepID=A0AAV4MPL8_CAEEX|nr:40S ribosomal protein S6 [Caerostris extrusa]